MALQHLGELSRQGQRPGSFKYELVACIGGRGFGIRREDMKKLRLATRDPVPLLVTRTVPSVGILPAPPVEWPQPMRVKSIFLWKYS